MSTFVTLEEFKKAVAAFQGNGGRIVDARTGVVDGAGELAGLVEKVKTFALAPAAEERRQKSLAKDRMLENCHGRELEELAKKSFHVKTFERLKFFWHTSTNLLAGVTSKLAALYDTPAKRYAKAEKLAPELEAEANAAAAKVKASNVDELPEDQPVEDPTVANDPELEALLDELDLDGSNDLNTDGYELLARATDLDVFLQKVERLARAHPCVWVRPIVSYDVDANGNEVTNSGRLDFVIFTPATADVLLDPENPTKALAWFYFTERAEGGTMKQTVHLFTETAFVTLNEKWEILTGPEVNELGMLPVAKFEIDVPTSGYYLDGNGDDLHAGTLEVCMLKTLQNARAKDFAFKQLAIQGEEKDVPADQVMGGPWPVMLGESATATVLDLQPNLDQYTQLAKERARDLENKHGIVVDVESAGAPESGYAKKLRMSAMIRENKRTRPHFARCERDLFTKIRRLLEVRPVEGLDLPTGELVTDFAEVAVEDSPEVQAKADANDLRNNSISILDVLARKNPDLSERELARLAWRNRRINEALLGSREEKVIDFLTLGEKPAGNAPAGAGNGGTNPTNEQAPGDSGAGAVP